MGLLVGAFGGPELVPELLLTNELLDRVRRQSRTKERTTMPYQTLPSDSVTIHIAAPPERVYDLIADITQMGRWSPECVRCEWLDDDLEPRAGARFKAHNKRGILRWSNTPTVVVADRPREFAFTRTGFGAGEYVWRYHIEADPNGETDLTESYDAVQPENRIISRFVSLFTPGTEANHLNNGMKTTLNHVREAAENHHPPAQQS